MSVSLDSALDSALAAVDAAVGPPRAAWWDCDNPTYHGDHEWIGHSMLKTFRESAKLYRDRYVTRSAGGDDEPGEKARREIDLGTVVHCLLLEPESLDRVVAEIPRDVLSKRGAREGKEWACWKADHAGRLHFTAGEMRKARRMAEAALAHDTAGPLLQAAGHRERGIRWTCPLSGLRLKCRPDLLIPGELLIDVKTTRDPTPAGFARTVADRGYHHQMPHYQDGAEAIEMVRVAGAWVAIGNEEPHEVGFYCPKARDLEEARAENEAKRIELAECYRTGDWRSDWTKGPQEIEVPRWGFNGRAL